MSKIKTQADFEKDKVLKAQYSTYDQYLSSNNPSLSDYVSVAETGSLPKEQPKSPYDTYMEEATRIYNQGVESNNQIAESQSASAGAEYREINRNINELNKASGKANTGYAGDTSIDAYNAYRNAVNSAYSNAQKSNNDLYSYYLGEMSRFQQAKENQEVTERQLSMQEQQARQQESAIVLSGLDNILSNENAYNENGTITSESAEQLWDYVLTYYGGTENIPNDVKATLNSTKGFSQWLDEYNKNGGTAPKTNYKFELRKVDNAGNVGDIGNTDFAVLNTYFDSETSSPIKDKRNDNFTISYFGKQYKLETGKQSEKPSQDVVMILNHEIASSYGRAPQQGDIAYYDGVFYVVTKDKGDFGPIYRSINDTRDYDKFVSVFKNKLGISEKND